MLQDVIRCRFQGKITSRGTLPPVVFGLHVAPARESEPSPQGAKYGHDKGHGTLSVSVQAVNSQKVVQQDKKSLIP